VTGLLDACSKWRELASCDLDGELVELERSRLYRHLRVCSDCAQFVRELDALTAAVRSSALEEPSRTTDLSLLRRRSARALVRSAAVASMAAAALAALVVGVPGSRTPEAAAGAPSSTQCAWCAPRSYVMSTLAPTVVTRGPVLFA
jgi:predicted anti-sigma-YlaC factor YlaD